MAFPAVADVRVICEPGSLAVACLTHAVELIVAFVSGAATGVQPWPGLLHVLEVDAVRTTSIVSPALTEAGTVTDFEVEEPGPECAAATNWICWLSEVMDTWWVMLLVAPLLSVTVSFTVYVPVAV